MTNGSFPRRGRVIATLAVAAGLLAAGCGGGDGSPGASGSSGHQSDVAFAHCMRSHGVPGWPDPLPGGGFPRTGSGNSGPQAKSAMKTCQHLLPAKPVLSAAQQARKLAQELKEAKCLRTHGFPDFPDPNVRNSSAGPFSFPRGFDPGSPQAQAAGRACHLSLPTGPAQGG
jgi:hypothetical protein